jgi:hypothetical protein
MTPNKEPSAAENFLAKSTRCVKDAVEVSYVAPQAQKIVNVALHREYSLGIIFIFSQGRKDLYHV